MGWFLLVIILIYLATRPAADLKTKKASKHRVFRDFLRVTSGPYRLDSLFKNIKKQRVNSWSNSSGLFLGLFWLFE